MSQAPVGIEIHEPLDAHRNLLAEITLDRAAHVNDLSDSCHLGFGQLVNSSVQGHSSFIKNRFRSSRADPKYIGQANLNPLVTRDVNASNTSHIYRSCALTLALLVFRVLTDHPHHTTPLDHAALATDLLHRSLDLHQTSAPIPP